jgi:hypothetical protein
VFFIALTTARNAREKNAKVVSKVIILMEPASKIALKVISPVKKLVYPVKIPAFPAKSKIFANSAKKKQLNTKDHV